MADMRLMCGRADGNSRESRRLYAEYYPQCRIPSYKFFRWILPAAERILVICSFS
jgi:hypothetical protein